MKPRGANWSVRFPSITRYRPDCPVMRSNAESVPGHHRAHRTAVTCASYQHPTRAQSSRRAHVSVCGFGAGKPVLSRSFSTLDRAETVPVACPSERRTRVIRSHSRAKPIPADLHRRRSTEPPPEPSKLVVPAACRAVGSSPSPGDCRCEVSGHALPIVLRTCLTA